MRSQERTDVAGIRTPPGRPVPRHEPRSSSRWSGRTRSMPCSHRECHALFPDELFADLFAAGVGRRSVPPLVVAVVMVLQRLEGLSDREAVERFTFDARWKYAAGGLPFDYPGFAHTVLVDMRARLARSERPDRIFERTLEVAKGAGLLGVRRVLDSTPLYDAVATMDTVTLVRSAIRGVLADSGEREPGAAGGPPPRRRLPHRAASPPPTGTTPTPGRPWSTPSPATGRRCSRRSRGSRSRPRSPRPRPCSPRCSARTSRTDPTAGSGSRGGSRPTG